MPILLRIETGAASGGVARDIEAIFNGDGDAEQRRPLLRSGKASGEGLRFRQGAFLVHREIHIPAGIAVGARQRFLRQYSRPAWTRMFAVPSKETYRFVYTTHATRGPRKMI